MQHKQGKHAGVTSISSQLSPGGTGCGPYQSAQATATDRSNPAADSSAISKSSTAADDAQGGEGKTPEKTNSTSDIYTPADRKTIEALKARDREVRAHEAAHRAAAGMYARGATSFTYQRGPDGGSYAVGGEVSIDVSPVQGDAHATAQKARQIQAAALAPAQPSGQDMAVAAQAAQMAMQASTESPALTSNEKKNADEQQVNGNREETPRAGAAALDNAEHGKATELAARANAYLAAGSSKSDTNPSLNFYA